MGNHCCYSREKTDICNLEQKIVELKNVETPRSKKIKKFKEIDIIINEKRSKCKFQHFDYSPNLSPLRKFSEFNSVHENKEPNNSDSFDFLRLSEKLSESKIFNFHQDDYFQTNNHFFTDNNFIFKEKKRSKSLVEIRKKATKKNNEEKEEEAVFVLKKTKSFSLEQIKTENNQFSEIGNVLHVIKELKNNIINFSKPVNHKKIRSLLSPQEFSVLFRNPSNINQDCSTQFPEESTISKFTIEPLSTAEQTPKSVSLPHVEEKISEILQYLKKLHKSNISFLIRYNEIGRPMVKVGGGYLTLDNYLSNLIQKIKSRAESCMEPDTLEKLTDYLEFVKKIDFKKEFNKQNPLENKKSSHVPSTSKSRFNFVKAVVIEKEKNEKIPDFSKSSVIKDKKKFRRSITSDVSQFSLNDSFRLSIVKTSK